MGIYPEQKKGREIKRRDEIIESLLVTQWVESVSEPGLMRERTVYATNWVETRTDCYCCTCGAHDTDTYMSSMSDPVCRNHGFAGRRPCDIHNLPGDEWDEEMSPDRKYIMPMAVNEYREAVKNGKPTH